MQLMAIKDLFSLISLISLVEPLLEGISNVHIYLLLINVTYFEVRIFLLLHLTTNSSKVVILMK